LLASIKMPKPFGDDERFKVLRVRDPPKSQGV
jgi:hypothetical protein